MLRITCPWCGEREEREFRYGGQGLALPAEADDETWGRVLYYRPNPAGLVEERWVHSLGCRQWFTVRRSTLTHDIVDVRTPGTGPDGRR